MSEIVKSGVYRHFRTGGRYVPLFVAHNHKHNGDKDVAYLSLEVGEYNVRPWAFDSRGESSWIDTVEWPNGKLHDRFMAEDALAEAGEFLPLVKLWQQPVERVPLDEKARAKAAWAHLEDAFAAFARVRPIDGATVMAWEILVEARDQFKRASRFGEAR